MKLHRIKSAIFKRFIGLMMLMGMAAGVYAQSAAEIGAMHNNCNHPNYQGDRSRCGGGNRAPVYTEVWENRFGALAMHPDTGNLYAAEGESSKRRAVNAALKSCGKKNCAVAINVRNGCIATVWWGAGYSYKWATDKAGAEAEAMNDCRIKNNNSGECELMYSGCSLPVRVR